jgi:NAD(P)-dependent dehydrogenase (short-subunit alcohol dehydrogenase family)
MLQSPNLPQVCYYVVVDTAGEYIINTKGIVFFSVSLWYSIIRYIFYLIMAKRLLNKIAIVTGSSSGLGRAISLAYHREGASVVCADLTPTARSQVPSETKINTHDLIKQQGGKSLFVETDVTDPKQMESLVSKAASAFGRLDVMVNNAGVALEAKVPGPIHKTTYDIWDKTMAINSTSVFLGCKYAIAQMLNQAPHSSGDKGWVINISSILGIIATRECPAYVASKGAVSNLTRQVALDYAKDRIHVNAICPGYTQTAIFAETIAHMEEYETLRQKHPFNGPGKPEDIAKLAVVLASDDASWVTGIALPVDGGYTAQ